MRFVVIGTGVIGALRAATVKANPTTELVGVCDANAESAGRVAASLGVKSYTDYRAMLAEARCDAVIISSPVHLHEEMCLAAFAAGCHVLCEKPLSNSVESCRRIYDAARAAGRTLAVGFNHRYYPSIKFLRQVLDEGRIGNIDHFRVFGGHDGLHNFRADWMYKGALSGGGAMMDVGIHMTDLTRFLAGDITEVYAASSGRIWNVEGSEDNAIALFRTEQGTPVRFHATWDEWQGYQISVEAYGDKGMVKAAYAPMYNLLITQEKPGAPRKREVKRYPEIILREKLKGWQTTTRQTFDDELADFLRMVDGQQVHLADGWSGVRAVEVAQAVYRSSAEGRAVHLEGEPGSGGAGSVRIDGQSASDVVASGRPAIRSHAALRPVPAGATVDADAPELSVVVPSVNGLGDLGGCLAALEAQRASVRLEVIVVDRLGATVRDEVARRFPWVRVIPVPAGTTIPQMRAEAFRVAGGNAVAVIEDHVITPPDWARQMLTALAEGANVVGGSIDNAAVDSLMDWATFLCEYSQCLPPLPPGPSTWLPGNNVTYRAELLKQFKDAAEAGHWENHLHDTLRQNGVELLCKPEIMVGHKKHYTFREYMSQRYLYARSYAGARAQGAPLSRRMVLGFGALALPPLLMARIVSRVYARPKYRALLVRSLPLITVFTFSWAYGEVVGAFRGAGNSLARVC